MIRISVMYPSGEGKTFDHRYYVDKHMPMVHARWDRFGLVRTEVDKGLAGGAPGAPAPFVAVGHVYFNALGDFQRASQAHGKELFDDVPNFTNIQPQVQISEVIG
jgi:uncharacterized protein (TIGR02118 family)